MKNFLRLEEHTHTETETERKHWAIAESVSHEAQNEWNSGSRSTCNRVSAFSCDMGKHAWVHDRSMYVYNCSKEGVLTSGP